MTTELVMRKKKEERFLGQAPWGLEWIRKQMRYTAELGPVNYKRMRLYQVYNTLTFDKNTGNTALKTMYNPQTPTYHMFNYSFLDQME